MSVSENMNLTAGRVPAHEYTQEKGIFIAEQCSAGQSFRNLSSDFPDYIPQVLYIRRWLRIFPQFAAIMREADEARAAQLMEETIDIADDIGRGAGIARNGIKARQDMAAALDPATYGKNTGKESPQSGQDTPLHLLTDSELMRIASGGRVIDGECSQVTPESGGTPPLDEGEGASIYGEVGSPTPASNSHEPFVSTTNSDEAPPKFEQSNGLMDEQDYVYVGSEKSFGAESGEGEPHGGKISFV